MVCIAICSNPELEPLDSYDEEESSSETDYSTDNSTDYYDSEPESADAEENDFDVGDQSDEEESDEVEGSQDLEQDYYDEEESEVDDDTDGELATIA